MIGKQTILAGGSRDIIVLNNSVQVWVIIQRNLRIVQRVFCSVLHVIINCKRYGKNCTKVLCQSFASNIIFPYDSYPHQILKPSKDHSNSYEISVTSIINCDERKIFFFIITEYPVTYCRVRIIFNGSKT